MRGSKAPEQLKYACMSVLTDKTHYRVLPLYTVAQKSQPLPNYQKVVINRVKACQ